MSPKIPHPRLLILVIKSCLDHFMVIVGNTVRIRHTIYSELSESKVKSGEGTEQKVALSLLRFLFWKRKIHKKQPATNGSISALRRATTYSASNLNSSRICYV